MIQVYRMIKKLKSQKHSKTETGFVQQATDDPNFGLIYKTVRYYAYIVIIMITSYNHDHCVCITEYMTLTNHITCINTETFIFCQAA